MHGNGLDAVPDAKQLESLPAAEQMMIQLQQASMQRYVSKSLYSDEYISSLTQAHREHAATLLEIHKKVFLFITMMILASRVPQYCTR